MAFVPDPAAIHDYMDRYRRDAFVLGGLPTSVYRETIEHALRRFPSCAGNVTIYWPNLPRTHPDQKHRGWCHVLCMTQDLRQILKGALNGHRIRPQSQPCTTRRAKYAIVCVFI
ncbi:hypothetical protein F4824DRAFT_223885 [Ustulina deusta]|nr:hypothetical protein F4824DRAFT_223885 [Ustulina deusta]